jgi:uncharacterized protein YbaP (TraB family)
MKGIHMASRLLSIKKRNRTITFILSFFFVLVAVAGPSAQQNEAATSSKSFLWEVKSSANKVYLLGSLHVLKSSAYPLNVEFDRAYAASQKLVFETDIGAMMEPAIQAKMLELGVYPEGQDIFQNISAGTGEKLENKLNDLGLPVAHFSRFKPWFLAVTLTSLELQRLGFNPLYGIDLHFYTKAKGDGKALVYLESIDYQLNLLGKMSPQDQNSFLDQSLKDLEIAAQLADDMMAAWQNGKTDKLYELLIKSFKDFPNIENRLLIQRNKDWLIRIEKLLKEPQITMVIVGAGHLIGPDSLVELLRKKGYKVKQK